MTRWRECEWGDIATLEYGKALRGYRDGHGLTRVFGTNGPIGWTESSPHSSGPGVVVGRKGAYRGIHFSPSDFAVIDTAFWLKPIEEMDMRWAYYELLTHDINSMDSGSAIPSTSRDAFYRMSVMVPPIEEQRGIAATLGALDDKLESNLQLIDCSLELLDLYSAELTVRQLNPVRLQDLVTVSRVSADPARMGDDEVDHFSIPAFDKDGLPERTQASSIMSNKLLIEQTSILVSRINPRINRTWWCVPTEGIPALASTEFIVLATASLADLGALWLAVRDEYFMNELKRRVTGTSGSHQRIRRDDLLAIEVPDVRTLLAAEKERALDLLILIHQRRAENRRLTAVRDVLLPDLLSGRIRVPEAQEAVA